MLLPPIRVHHPHVVCDSSVLQGSPLVAGTKVPVRRLWSWHRKGVSVEPMLKRYPQLGPARLLDALSFAYDNTALVDADLAREERLLGADPEPVPGAMQQESLPFARNGRDN